MKRTRLAVQTAAALLVGFAGLGGARAQVMEVHRIKLVQPTATGGEEKKGDKKKEVPVYRAVISHSVPGLKAEDFELKDLDVEPPVVAKADKVVDYKNSDDPMSMVILIQGDERWMGNETYIENEDEKIEGAFTALGPAIDALTKAGPPGSMGALLIYSGGSVTERQKLGAIDGLSAALGTQADYKDIGVPLIPGLDEAWKVLGQASGRKVLVVFGDGTGQQENIGPELKDRIKKFKDMDAEVFTVYYAGRSDDPAGPQNMKNLGYSGHYSATSRDNMGAFAADIVTRIGSRYYVDFPAAPFATKEQKEREVVVVVKDEESEPVAVATIKPAVKEEGGSLWWLWLLIILLVLVIVVVIIAKRGKSEPAPPPMVEAPVEAAPAGPQKTIMLGVGGDDEGMPIVGWVVPLSGPNQFQTFKLLQGATVLGTGGGAHIVVSDQYMSTEHAEIICSPAGFLLKDGGSTNGTLVNDKRISSHELVDNDVFTLGQTPFKFKSIN